jgi:hypothetical protein
VADLMGALPKISEVEVNGGFDFRKQKETIKEVIFFKHS